MENKLRLIGIIFCLSIALNSVYSQNKHGFTIDGSLTGLKENTILYLVHNGYLKKGKSDTIGLARLKNGQFTFRGHAKYEGEPYFITFDEKKRVNFKDTIRSASILILIENKPIEVKGSIDNFGYQNLEIKGSLTHDEYKELTKSDTLRKRTNELLGAINKIRTEDPAMKGKFQNKLLAMHGELIRQININWINSHPDSYLTPWLLPQIYDKDEDIMILAKCYDQLSQRLKECLYGLELKKRINIKSKTAIGMKSPELNLLSINGMPLSLHSVAKKNKLIILDFWAHWCQPCRASFPAIKELYSKYHDKGLEVYGVSIDVNSGNWKKALAEDQLPWLNVILKEKSTAEDLYGIKVIPTSFLLDTEGKILLTWSGENKDLEKIILKKLNEQVN